jgi:hypothetical protein
MTSTSMLAAWATSTFGSLLLVGTVAAQPPSSAVSVPGRSNGAHFRCRAGTARPRFSGHWKPRGRCSSGAIWCVDIRTGERRRIGSTTDLAWPVASPDGIAVYALRGRQVLRIAVADGTETTIGIPADWRKLLGVLPDHTVLGFVEDDPRPRPALLAPDGGRTDLPPPVDEVEQKRNGILLQEGRDYADGTRLEVRDSTRGGRGRDVFLIDVSGPRNLTDCGDDFCGQPARSHDGLAIFYIRAPG